MKRTKLLNVKVTEEEKERVKYLAEVAGEDLATFIRNRLLGDSTQIIGTADDKKIVISKYEDDILTYTLNNTLLIRHLFESKDEMDVVKDAKDFVNNWKEKRYTTHKE